MINYRRTDFYRDNSANSKQSAQLPNTSNQPQTTNVSAIGEKKRLKVQFIQNQPNAPSNVNLQINPKTWSSLRVNDIIEVSAISNLTGSNANTTTPTSGQQNSSLNRGAHSALIQLSSSSTNTSSLNQINSSFTNDDESSPFILKVVQASFNDSIPIDTIRIDQVASSAPFSIKNFGYVYATIIDPSTVMLDLVEVIFKEQYLNGYDMLRIKKDVEQTCVHIKKNIEFCSIRCSVRDLWAPNAENVTCGYIGEKTRLVFRSQSAMCLIYIQMSREMWEFDVNGEMYHEKAINFLGELFTNWKNQSCTHDVTIALFSRIYYDAKSKEEFPNSISSDIKRDHKNRYFEDFFRVVYQNERYEDWTPTLIILKRLIKEYRDYVLNYHRRQLGLNMPNANLSSAAEGNFLETLNLSSSVFERHFIDRPFDRTGMMSLVITPGNGIYEVSRELAKITKERVIDNGIGSDLVCLGEQPLHAVPLFKYDTVDAYDIPNWINLSFYKSSEMVRFCNSYFLPSSKIKLKNSSFFSSLSLSPTNKPLNSDAVLPGYKPDKNSYLKSLEDTDNIFEIYNNNSNNNNNNNTSNVINTKYYSYAMSSQKLTNGNRMLVQTSIQNKTKPLRRHNASLSNLSSSIISNNEHTNNVLVRKKGYDFENQQSYLNNGNMDEYDDYDNDSTIELESDNEQNYSNAKDDENGMTTNHRRSKQKLNPFMPSSIKNIMCSQRRPWAHIFPLRSDGSPIFPHSINPMTDRTNIYQENKQKNSLTISAGISSTNEQNLVGSNKSNNTNIIPRVSPDSNSLYLKNQQNFLKDKIQESNNAIMLNLMKKKESIINKSSILSNKANWEASNLDESMAIVKTGVAWKSLTTPACLPLTTDYFPSETTMKKKFVRLSDYSLLLDDIRDEYGYKNYEYNNEITIQKVFKELVGHRLAMGFQIVVPKNIFTYNNTSTNNTSESMSTTPSNTTINPIQSHTLTNTLTYNFIFDLSQSSSSSSSSFKTQRGTIQRTQLSSIRGYCKLSLGRIFHELFYIVDESNKSEYVKVEIYVPEIKKTKQSNHSIEYKYRFQVPDSKTYDISYCEMSRKSIEAVKWNYIDRYISIQGNGSLTPSELEKCWRQRLYLLPILYVSNKIVCNEHSSSPGQYLSSSLNSLGFTNLTQSQIPASMIQNPYSTLKCDIFQRKSNEELKFMRDYYFIKFMEGLNKLNRADDRRAYSKSTLAYLEMFSTQNTNSSSTSSSLNNQTNTNASTNNLQDLIVAVSAITSALTQINNSNSINNSNINKNQLISLPTLNQKQQFQNSQIKLTSPKIILYPLVCKYIQSPNEQLKAEIVSIINNEYKIHMLNSSYGIPCIQNKKDIPLNCFITAEAVWWCIEHINEIDYESDAILFMQLMSDFDLIRHISNQQKIFIHGFYLFYVITDENRNHHLYTKDYCEVGFTDIESGRSSDNLSEKFSLISVKDLLPEHTYTLPVSAKDMFDSYLGLYNNLSKTKFNNMAPDAILKLVNVDVDPSRKSDRAEWASAVYRSHYHQLCAFELEVQWEVATCSLLSETVSGWSKLSNRFNYHIVPAPIDPFAMPLVPNSDPLRGPIYIGLNIGCLIENESILFEDLIEEKYKYCLEELFSDKFMNQPNTFKFESSSSESSVSSESLLSSASVSTTTTTSNTLISNNNGETLFKILSENAPEFIRFLYKKHDKKTVNCRLHEDYDFIRHEFLEFVEYERIIRLIYFQEAILEKFGFVRNAAVVKYLFSDDDPTFFIHASGGMFVYIPNYYNNYSIRSRHSSANANNQNSINESKSSLILNKTNELLKNEIENGLSKRDRLITQTSELSEDFVNLKPDTSINTNHTSKNTSGNSSAKTSFNASLNNSYVSNSNLNNNITATNTNNVSRDRSNTKSQHLQFLKLNEKHYLQQNQANDGRLIKSSESKEEDDKISVELINDVKDGPIIIRNEESKNDLLFKPKSSNSKFSTKNEKIDQIQHQHQKEQMLLQTFVNSTNSSYYKYLNQRENRQVPFYADTEQFIGFFWSWNFMLGKRWRSQYTGDEQFQDNMLTDFKLFCTNQDGRLEKFFKESKAMLKLKF